MAELVGSLVMRNGDTDKGIWGQGALHGLLGGGSAGGMGAVGGGYLMRALGIGGSPDEVPAPPKASKLPSPPMAAQPKAPENIPGSEDRTQSATIKDEKRRILTMMPRRTRNTYAGAYTRDAALSEAVVKKTVLGGGIGRQTTGE